LASNAANEPTVYRYWDLSTKHISLEDAGLLVLLETDRLTVYPYEYGFHVLVPQDDVDETLDDLADQGFSEALRIILRRAYEQGVRMVRFDADGDLVIGLEQFDW
jgi:hypothetical protein